MMEQINRFKTKSSEGTILLTQIVKERSRMAALQQLVDQDGERLVREVHAGTVARTYDLRNEYDLDFFRTTLFSDDVKRRLAQALLDATRPFHSMIDTTVWTKIVEGP